MATRHEPTNPRWPKDIVCFGGEDWWYHNRGHCDIQFMRQFARHGRVLYVNSIVMRKFNVTEGAMFWRRLIRKSQSMARGLVRITDRFWVYSPLTAPVHHLPAARSTNERLLREQVNLTMRRIGMSAPLVWVNCPAACDTALALRRSGLVYQRTDRYEDHPGVDVGQILRYDQKLKKHADLTFYSNRKLHEEEASQCRNAAYVEHGLDYELFAHAAKDTLVPPEIRTLSRPIVGFFGGIDNHKFNIALMAQVAKKLPDVTFAFVGQASIDCSPLTQQPHVIMTGQRPYHLIPHYGKCFDVCVLPFNQNRWVEAMNPIKLKEYLALGKPIVATPFSELTGYTGFVHIADNADGFAAAIRRAMADNSSTAAMARRRRVSPHSWHNKAVEVLTSLHQEHEISPKPAMRPGSNGRQLSSRFSCINPRNREGGTPRQSHNGTTCLCGTFLDALSMSEVIGRIQKAIQTETSMAISVVNVTKAVNMRRDPWLRDSVESGTVILADGMPLVWLSRLKRRPLPQRVTGIDLMHELFKLADQQSLKVFFLGAAPEVVKRVADLAHTQYPHMTVAGWRDGYFSEPQEQEIANHIRRTRPDILLVAMSSPKKELFMRQWSHYIDVPICHGVGGSFDVMAGRTRRAPSWMQQNGLEWLYRVIQEPRRMWKRYLVTGLEFAHMASVCLLCRQDFTRGGTCPWRNGKTALTPERHKQTKRGQHCTPLRRERA